LDASSGRRIVLSEVVRVRPLRVLIGVVLVAGAGAAGLYGSGFLLDRFGPAEPERRNGPSVARVETAPATVAPVRRTAEAVGSTKAQQSIDVQPMSAGRVTAVNIREGSEVRAGDLLVQLDDRAEQAALREAEATVAEVRGNGERARQLAQQNIQSDAALEAVEALILRAEAAREQALNAVEDRRVVAAFDGRVGLADVDVGQMVATTTVLTSLDNLSSVDVTFSLPERYLAEIRSGQTIEATTTAYPDRRFTGTVSAVGTRVDALSRSFTIEASIPNEDRALTTGMFMGVSIVLEERQSVGVPEVAVVNEGDRAYVFVADGEIARRRDIETGLRQGERVEVLSGIAEGESVVVSGLQSLSDGERIEVAPRAPSAGEAVAGAPGAPAGRQG
jgi:membrane fusion protein, multidrug efflux system